MFNNIKHIRVLLITLLTVICLPLTGSADKLEGGGYTLYDVINSGGMTLQDASNIYTLQDSKGDTLGGKLTGGEYTFVSGLFGLIGGIKIGDAPWGTVPLTIVRDGENIKITWDAALAPGAKIYVLTGNGTGQFQKTDVNAWKLYKDIVTQFDVTGVTTGTLLHKGQVGSAAQSGITNHPESYYFGLQAGITPQTICQDTDPLYKGKTCFLVAPAIGKVHVAITPGPNLFATPFTREGFAIGTALANQTDVNGVEIYQFDDQGKTYTKATFNGTAWGYEGGSSVDIIFGKAFWVRNWSGALTVLGKVSGIKFTRKLYSGANILGAPTPQGMLLNLAGLSPINNHEIYLFNNGNKTYDKLSGDGTSWNVPPNSGQPSFGLKPGVGYYYKNPGSDFDWNLVP